MKGEQRGDVVCPTVVKGSLWLSCGEYRASIEAEDSREISTIIQGKWGSSSDQSGGSGGRRSESGSSL